MTSGRLLECKGLKMTTRGQKKCHTKSTLTMKLYTFIVKMSAISEGVGGKTPYISTEPAKIVCDSAVTAEAFM